MKAGSLAKIHDVSLKLDRFCTDNPAIRNEISVYPLFMTAVNDAMAEMEATARRAKSAEVKASVLAVKAGLRPAAKTRRKIRPETKIV